MVTTDATRAGLRGFAANAWARPGTDNTFAVDETPGAAIAARPDADTPDVERRAASTIVRKRRRVLTSHTPQCSLPSRNQFD